MWIRIRHFRSKRIRSLGLHKGRQATREAFRPQKRTSITSKLEIPLLFRFPIFVGNFCPPGSGSGSSCAISMRIQKRNTVANKALLHENKYKPFCVTDSTFSCCYGTRNIYLIYLGLLLSSPMQPALRDTTLPSLEPST
jgi:hypothetical protein